MRAVGFAILSTLFAVATRADVIDLSRVRIVWARKENPQQKIAADEQEKCQKLVCGSEVGETGFTFVFAWRSGDTVFFCGDDKDWEATAFFNSAMSFSLESRFDKLVALFNAYPGATLNERIEAYVLSNGFTRADIETLRRILLEPGQKPSGK